MQESALPDHNFIYVTCCLQTGECIVLYTLMIERAEGRWLNSLNLLFFSFQGAGPCIHSLLMINSERGGRLGISKYVRHKTEIKAAREKGIRNGTRRERERESDTDGETERLPLLFLQSVSSVFVGSLLGNGGYNPPMSPRFMSGQDLFDRG